VISLWIVKLALSLLIKLLSDVMVSEMWYLKKIQFRTLKKSDGSGYLKSLVQDYSVAPRKNNHTPLFFSTLTSSTAARWLAFNFKQPRHAEKRRSPGRERARGWRQPRKRRQQQPHARSRTSLSWASRSLSSFTSARPFSNRHELDSLVGGQASLTGEDTDQSEGNRDKGSTWPRLGVARARGVIR
jgi:hypothetical protein